MSSFQRKFTNNQLEELEDTAKGTDIYREKISQKETMSIDEYVKIIKEEMQANEDDTE
jgi:hypothetical protein